MQLNQALFMLGGGSGYVPQPDVMRDDAFDPFDKDTLRVEPITIQLQVRSKDENREQHQTNSLFVCCCFHGTWASSSIFQLPPSEIRRQKMSF